MDTMDVKGQASVEYLLLTLVFLIIISTVTIPLLITPAITDSLDVSHSSDASAAINSIANAVGVVSANGPGSVRTINVYFSSGGIMDYNSINGTIEMPVALNSTSKVIDASVPNSINFNSNLTSVNINNKTNYVVTVKWPSGDSPINVNLLATS
jgi:uncharacterized protein (UPF0333 family)